jgi:hypothetical protein
MMKLKINKTSINGSRKKNVKKKTKVEKLIIKRVKLWFLGNEREKKKKKINRWQTRPLAPTPLHMKEKMTMLLMIRWKDIFGCWEALAKVSGRLLHTSWCHTHVYHFIVFLYTFIQIPNFPWADFIITKKPSIKDEKAL